MSERNYVRDDDADDDDVGNVLKVLWVREVHHGNDRVLLLLRAGWLGF